MGHIGASALKALKISTIGCLVNEQPAEGDQLVEKCKNCDICIQAKATAIIGRERPRDATEYLEKVHSDICGPIRPQTFTKRRYFCTFIDDKSRYAEVTLLQDKAAVLDAYKEWKTREETQTGLKVKRFHADNAAEYKSSGFNDIHKTTGTIATYSAPYTPAQNGRAERPNRTLMEKARAMLIEAKLPKAY
jgi:transposase InsO family protein